MYFVVFTLKNVPQYNKSENARSSV